MNRPHIPRRDLLRAYVAAGADAESLPERGLFGSGPNPTLDPKCLRAMPFGKMGIIVPRIGAGSFDDTGCFAGLHLWRAAMQAEPQLRSSAWEKDSLSLGRANGGRRTRPREA